MISTKQYIECIPAAQLPLSSPEEFTYHTATQDLTIGSLVRIPFRKKTITGIVTKIHKPPYSPPYTTRAIQEILTHIPPLPEELRKTVKQAGDYYCTSQNLIYKSVLPFIPKRVPKENKVHKEEKDTGSKEKATKEQQQAIFTIRQKQEFHSFLLHGPTGSGKTEVYLQSITQHIQNKEQVIILVPEISLTPQAYDRYTKRFSKNEVSIYHSQQTASERFNNWLAFATGKTKILIGPRSAIWTPANKLGMIIIDEAHETTYKQWDQHPRYDARTVAEIRANINNIPIVLGTATPRLEDLYIHSSKQQHTTLLQLTKRISGKMPSIDIIDMSQEIRAGNTSPLSLPLQEKIEATLKRKKQVVLFHNRRGSATCILCRDCGFVSTCPNCEVPLVYHHKYQHTLQCHHCGNSRI